MKPRDSAEQSDCQQSAVHEPLVGALDEALCELSMVLGELRQRTYVDTKLDAGFGSTIGKHVRHVADHVRAVCDAVRTGHAAYEARTRGTEIETDPAAACKVLSVLAASLRGLTESECEKVITIEQAAYRDRAALVLPSTVLRELGFVYAHTIHHLAIIRMMLARSSEAPAISSSFGLAPGTPMAHARSCAQ